MGFLTIHCRARSVAILAQGTAPLGAGSGACSLTPYLQGLGLPEGCAMGDESPNKSGAKSPKSCLSGDGLARQDSRGNVIDKDKKHKITFLDEAKPGTNVAIIHEVQTSA